MGGGGGVRFDEFTDSSDQIVRPYDFQYGPKNSRVG